MTRIILSLSTFAGILALASCTTIKDPGPAEHTSSTTTESTSVQQPVEQPAPAATETQVVRSY